MKELWEWGTKYKPYGKRSVPYIETEWGMQMAAFSPEKQPLIERVYVASEVTLRKVALSCLKDEEKANDAVQESAKRFIEAFDSLTYISDKKLKGYLYLITRSVISEVKGKEKGKNRREIPISELQDEFVIDAEEFVLGQYGAQIIKEKIKQLPPHYCLYIDMAYMDQCPPQAIAKALGVKESTLRSTACRARKRLQELCREGSEVDGCTSGKK